MSEMLRKPSVDSQPRRHRDLRDERGQVVFFVITMFLTMILIAATAINIGQAVNRRLMLQILADTGAFTGASEMARGLNTLARLNKRIQRDWASLTQATVGFTIAPCAVVDPALALYRIRQTTWAQMMRQMNAVYGGRATSEARRVTRLNAAQLFPRERSRIAARAREGGGGFRPQRPGGRVVPMSNRRQPGVRPVRNGTPAAPDVFALSPARTNPSFMCTQPPLPAVPRRPSLRVWYEKSLDPQVGFVWVVTAPATRARVFDRFFGGRAIPEMTAAAWAAPVGGEIRMGRERYRVGFRRLRDMRPSVSSIFNRALGRNQRVRH